jgi:hypothetical protein
MKQNLLSITLFLVMSIGALAANAPVKPDAGSKYSSKDSIATSISLIKRYLHSSDGWKADNQKLEKALISLVHYSEDVRIDSVISTVEKFMGNPKYRLISRPADLVGDSLKLKGFVPYPTILEKVKQLDRAVWNGVDLKSIPLHENLIAGPDGKIPPIEPNDEASILRRTGVSLPDSLENLQAIPDSLIKTGKDLSRSKKLQELRSNLLEKARQRFNARIAQLNLDSAVTVYRKYAVQVFSDSLQSHLRDSLVQQNKAILVQYNDSVVRAVNDSVAQCVRNLQRFAENDSVSVWIQSLSGQPTHLALQNNHRSVKRFYIKNQQNDSLAIRLMNLDKKSIGIAIDDDVTFDRIAKKQGRSIAFEPLAHDQKLNGIKKRYNIVTPWIIGGNGTFGLTQTYLNNWKAGGKSAFSFLMVLKGYANYSNDKLKWENSGELRNGWIHQGGDINQTQKNDDKLELISRLGISAFKKWYYSSEIDFVTQFFNGYNYPDKLKPISSYLSPAKTLFKLGMDYKPNKNFSVFLSPVTAKTVFVRDTILIDQTRFGVPQGARSFWEVGLNADLRYKVDITPQISVETKYKMFMNYNDPFKKVDINWENTVIAQLTDRINLTFMVYFLYDDNVTFDTGNIDTSGKPILKPKWQTKELMTVGFSYKLNRFVYRQKRVD